MKKRVLLMVFLSVTVCFAGEGLAKELMVFPANGQDEEQMGKDKYACYSWAKKESGFDPMEVPRATAPPPEKAPAKGGVVRGGAGGAAAGAAVGSFSGEAGEGAKKGAAAGAIIGGLRRRNQNREQAVKEQKWAEQQASNYAQKRSDYNRAYGACLEGKGYTVK